MRAPSRRGHRDPHCRGRNRVGPPGRAPLRRAARGHLAGSARRGDRAQRRRLAGLAPPRDLGAVECGRRPSRAGAPPCRRAALRGAEPGHPGRAPAGRPARHAGSRLADLPRRRRPGGAARPRGPDLDRRLRPRHEQHRVRDAPGRDPARHAAGDLVGRRGAVPRHRGRLGGGGARERLRDGRHLPDGGPAHVRVRRASRTARRPPTSCAASPRPPRSAGRSST